MKTRYQKDVDKLYSNLTNEQLAAQVKNMINSEWHWHHQIKWERCLKELAHRVEQGKV